MSMLGMCSAGGHLQQPDVRWQEGRRLECWRHVVCHPVLWCVPVTLSSSYKVVGAHPSHDCLTEPCLMTKRAAEQGWFTRLVCCVCKVFIFLPE